MKQIVLGDYPRSGLTIGGYSAIHVYYSGFFLLVNDEKFSLRLGTCWIEIKFGRSNLSLRNND